MIIERSHDASCFFGNMQTTGASNVAHYIGEQVGKGLERLRMSASFGYGMDVASEELSSVAEECAATGWDGYAAIPIERETIWQAERFLKALPLGMPAPAVSAEPDGHVTFEWYKSPRRVMSVSISQEGELHYAALLGSRKNYGTEPFFGKVPSEIQRLICSVFQYDC